MEALARCLAAKFGAGFTDLGMGQYLLIPFLVGWTSIYQLFWGSLGTRVLTHPHFFLSWKWYVDGPISKYITRIHLELGGNYPIFRVVLFPFDFESVTYELEEHGIFILPMVTLGVSWSMVIFRGALWWSLRIVNDSHPNLDWFTFSARSRAWRTMFDAFIWVWVTAWDPGLNIQIPVVSGSSHSEFTATNHWRFLRKSHGGVFEDYGETQIF